MNDTMYKEFGFTCKSILQLRAILQSTGYDVTEEGVNKFEHDLFNGLLKTPKQRAIAFYETKIKELKS